MSPAGRKPLADDVIRCTVTLDSETLAVVEAFGNGNRSLGVRNLAAVAHAVDIAARNIPSAKRSVLPTVDDVLGGRGQFSAAFASIRDVE